MKFAQFIKKPHKLDPSFNSSHVADICKICGVSATKLNKMVSDNIGTIGKPVTIDPKRFDEEEWAKGISKKLGDCYIIDEFGSNAIYYSIPNKKIYWINFEHAECEEFFNNFPYGSKEFEDMAFMLNTEEYADYEEGQAVKELFKKLDKEKKFNILD